MDRHAGEEPVAAAVVEVEVRVDDGRDTTYELVRQRVRPRVPVSSSRRMGVDHPRVDEHEPVGVLDRVDEHRDEASSAHHLRGQQRPDIVAGEQRREHTEDPMATTTQERRLLVDGEWLETGSWIEVRSPYSGEVVGRVAKGGAAETRRARRRRRTRPRRAAAGARAGGDPRPRRGPAEERREEMARTICAEAGKPIRTARVEASRAVSTYTFAAVEARKLAGEAIPMDASEAGEGKLAFTLRRPIGIVGAISPFNFPCNLVAHKLAPALAAGCPVVLKPASQTPLSALLLAELEQEAGLPAGWLNVLVGPASEIGDVLVADERVKLITFTGSSGVGWGLQERAPRKRVRLELGNSTPAIVAADADLELAAAKLAANAFSFAGQSCISVQRIYVERSVLRRLHRPASSRRSRRWWSATRPTRRPTSAR